MENNYKQLLEALDWAFNFDSLDSDMLFDSCNALECLKELVKKNPDELIKWCTSTQAVLESKMVANMICPNCGGSIETVSDHRFDNYVPYGSTYVRESEGYQLVCENCDTCYGD